MTRAEALATIRTKATDGTLPIKIDDPDQYLWGLGAVGGPDGLLDSLKDATEIRSVPGGDGSSKEKSRQNPPKLLKMPALKELVA